MGLGNLIDGDVDTSEETSSGHPLKRYGSHEKDEVLEEAVEELRERFPIKPDIEFIEVSPRMSKTPAKLYTQERDDETVMYIRVSEPFTNHQDHYIRQSILYLMVQAYFKELGFTDISPANDEFKWVCGQVGAPTNPIDTTELPWKIACAPFLDEESGLTEMEPDSHLDHLLEGGYDLSSTDDESDDGGEVPPPEEDL